MCTGGEQWQRGGGFMVLLWGGKWGCYKYRQTFENIIELTEVIIWVDRTGMYTIKRDQMVGYYVYIYNLYTGRFTYSYPFIPLIINTFKILFLESLSILIKNHISKR